MRPQNVSAFKNCSSYQHNAVVEKKLNIWAEGEDGI